PVGLEISAQDHARHFIGEKQLITAGPLFLAQRLQKRRFGAADYLHSFTGKIFCKPSQRQTRTIHGWLANDPFQSRRSGQQLQAERAGLLGIEPLDRYLVPLHRQESEMARPKRKAIKSRTAALPSRRMRKSAGSPYL